MRLILRVTFAFREHLGVSVTNPDINVIDPVCDSFYRDQWQQQATTNTQVYEEVGFDTKCSWLLETITQL